MNKYFLAIALTLTGLFTIAQARIRGNIPATYIENRELVFRHTRLNSPKNPLQVQVVVDDNNGNELALNLPVTIGLGGRKATVQMPTVGSDTRVSFEVWGGRFSKENRFKHTMIIFDDPLLNLTAVLDQGEELISIPDQFSSTDLFGKEGPQGPEGPQGATGAQGPQGPIGPTPTNIPSSNIQGPTPVAVDSSDIDVESSGGTINATNINYITLADSNNATIDTVEFITGCSSSSKGQELIIELKEDVNFLADNQDTANKIQWGRGTGVNDLITSTDQREMIKLLCNGSAWFLLERFSL